MSTHIVTVESRPCIRYGYADMPYDSADRFVVCTCGWRKQLFDSSNSDRFAILRLSHLVEVLAQEAGITISELKDTK